MRDTVFDLDDLSDDITDLCFAICRLTQVVFITSDNLAQNLFSISDSRDRGWFFKPQSFPMKLRL